MNTNAMIANIELNGCIMNASGVLCTNLFDLKQLDKSDTCAIVSKSCTLNRRDGNDEPRMWIDDMRYLKTINSTGLANLGCHFYRDVKQELNKPYFISISGLSIQENIDIINCLNEKPPDAIELNLSCPNICGKSQIGYDFISTEEMLRKIFENGVKSKLGLKLPPYFDFMHIQEMVNILYEFKGIEFITCINSLGRGMFVDPINESIVIKPNFGLGGIGGEGIKPIALSNVYQFSHLTNIDVIGCGGIKNGWDVFEHILVGAKAVQIGSILYRAGPQTFKQLNDELKEIMGLKGYKSIHQFRGCIQKI